MTAAFNNLHLSPLDMCLMAVPFVVLVWMVVAVWHYEKGSPDAD